MAISESIRSELNALFDVRVEFDCFCKSLELVQDEERSGNANPLVYVLSCYLDRLSVASDALERTLRRNVLPLVEDMERATK